MGKQTVLRLGISLRETFSNWLGFTGINKYVKHAVVHLWTVFQPVYHVTCQRILWNGTFLDIYLTTFLGICKFKNTFELWGSYFFWISLKFKLNLENAKGNWENIFRFWDNCIWKCCYELSLLRRKHLLSDVNRLRNSAKILQITQRDFFYLNCLHRDASIW